MELQVRSILPEPCNRQGAGRQASLCALGEAPCKCPPQHGSHLQPRSLNAKVPGEVGATAGSPRSGIRTVLRSSSQDREERALGAQNRDFCNQSPPHEDREAPYAPCITISCSHRQHEGPSTWHQPSDGDPLRAACAA